MEKSIALIVDLAERTLVVMIAIPFLLAFVQYLPTHPYALCLVTTEAASALFILIRKPGMVVVRAYPILIALLGTTLPLLARPGDVSILPQVVTGALMFVGVIVSLSAKVFLNRSFGMVAANRGVKRGGPYRIVRHPMYLGYFITQLGFLLSAFSPILLALYIMAWTFQVLRIIEEERFLMLDPDYRAFALAVPRRVLPGF